MASNEHLEEKNGSGANGANSPRGRYAAALRAAIAEVGWTVERLAREVRVAVQTAQNWIDGTHLPRKYSAATITGLLGLGPPGTEHGADSEDDGSPDLMIALDANTVAVVKNTVEVEQLKRTIEEMRAAVDLLLELGAKFELTGSATPPV
jgi:hypothetical protein